MTSFYKALFATYVIETIVIYLFLRDRLSVVKTLFSSFLINLLTLPFVWFIFPQIFSNSFLSLILSEIFAFLAEAGLLSMIVKNFKLGIMISLFANFSSLLFGLSPLWQQVA